MSRRKDNYEDFDEEEGGFDHGGAYPSAVQERSRRRNAGNRMATIISSLQRNDDDDDAIGDELDDDEPAPKRRGRPRKNPASEAPAPRPAAVQPGYAGVNPRSSRCWPRCRPPRPRAAMSP